jgi:hypothetical protein
VRSELHRQVRADSQRRGLRRGSGNGPAYVYGVVRVIGTDVYDLDRDNDGYGCD